MSNRSENGFYDREGTILDVPIQDIINGYVTDATGKSLSAALLDIAAVSVI